mgnify:CR=1 FL=1
MVKVGIPRALLYYEYYPMWRAFFDALGAELVVSESTTKDVAASGVARVTAETCFPVKIFMGHVISLIGKCDFIFVPAVRSMEEKVHNCSKFLGLPDMTRAVIPECPPLLEVDIDMEKKRELYSSVYALGRHFTWNPLKVRRAAKLALQSHGEYKARMVREGKTPSEVLEGKSEQRDGSSSVALVGHPYLLYDDYVNHRLISRLEGQGVIVLTPEMVSQADMKQATHELAGGSYWTYEDEVIGAGGYYIKKGVVDGVISVMAFGCGPDSVMMHILDRYARRERRPYTCLTLDEHTAEAGLATRVEAFIDMVRKRR